MKKDSVFLVISLNIIINKKKIVKAVLKIQFIASIKTNVSLALL
jgi:hypothetical protein